MSNSCSKLKNLAEELLAQANTIHKTENRGSLDDACATIRSIAAELLLLDAALTIPAD